MSVEVRQARGAVTFAAACAPVGFRETIVAAMAVMPRERWLPARMALRAAIGHLPGVPMAGAPKGRRGVASAAPRATDEASTREALRLLQRASWGWDWPEPGFSFSGRAACHYADTAAVLCLEDRADEAWFWVAEVIAALYVPNQDIVGIVRGLTA